MINFSIKNIYNFLFKYFIFVFLVIIVIASLIFFMLVNLDFLKDHLSNNNLDQEKFFQHKFLNNYRIIEKSKTEQDFTDYIVDIFNSR